MNAARKNDIRGKAEEINALSEQFQLIHATYASSEYIKDIVRGYYQKKLSELKTRISEKISRELDTTQELLEKSELEDVIRRNNYTVDIGYIDISDDNIARVIKSGKSFTIYLASSLRDTITKPNGDFDYKVIGKIRKLMAHEIGHMVLHTKELLLEDGTQGTLNIKDCEKEEEAEFFGRELLELRRKRNKKIREDGGADSLF
ncbi:MAG: ImmA/IrrE family metallo-endopeptidase [Blautia sp.]|nr:ImmA/IrrE family metallo-endopeptidase [Blautia sp.]